MVHVHDDEKWLCTEKIIPLLGIPISTVNVHPYHYHVGSQSFDFTCLHRTLASDCEGQVETTQQRFRQTRQLAVMFGKWGGTCGC